MKPLVGVLRRIEEDDQSEVPGLVRSTPPPETPAPGKLADRFTEDDVACLLELYHQGSTIKALAEHFNIGTTSVKRLIKKHGQTRTAAKQAAVFK